MLYQQFRRGNEHFQIFVFTDADTGQRYVPLENILDSYPNVTKVLLDGAPVPFMTDALVQEYDPPRIPYYPGETLEVVTASSASLGSAGPTTPSSPSPLPRPPPIPPRPPSFGPASSTQYLLLNNSHHHDQQDPRQEERQPFQPHSRNTKHQSPHSLMNYFSGQLTFRFEESLAIRLALFSIMVILVAASQLSSFSSKVIDGYIGERDNLKQRIIYWATGCSIIHGAMLYFLARWFTKDLVWHWDSKDLRHLWGLSPSVASILVVFHVRAPSIIIIAVILTLIAVFATVINLWLTSATSILPLQYQAPMVSNITLMDIPWIREDNFTFGYQNGAIFDSFVQQGSIGNLGRLQLTPYQGKYLWAPIFEADKPTDIFVENVRGFSVEPVCTQLNNTEIGAPYFDPTGFLDSRTVRLGPFNATIPGSRGHSQYWGFFADGEEAFDLDDRETVRVYNLLANGRREFGAPTFEFTVNDVSNYVYAVTCNLTAEAWNISGYISSYSHQRLYSIQSATRLNDSGATYLWWTMRGLDRWTKTTLARKNDNEGRGLLSMMWMWMQGRKYSDQGLDVPLLNVSIADWTQQKLTEIMAATLTTSTASIQPRVVRGAYMVETSVIRVNAAKLVGGLLFQLAYIALAVGLYIVKRTGPIYRSDDITHLLKKDVVVDLGRPL